jgi:signal transduction histidine kinase
MNDIARDSGGKIWAENSQGVGAVFRFTLPLVRLQSSDLSVTVPAQ